MLIFPSEAVLINPSVAALLAALEEARRIANGFHRVRRVNSEAMAVAQESAHIFGFGALRGPYEWAHGGGVIQPWGDDATTSVLGCAWWRSPDRSWHVRVVGGRVAVPATPGRLALPHPFGVPGLTPADADALTLVYPALRVRCPDIAYEGVEAALARELLVRPVDRTAWSVLADWREDQEDASGLVDAQAALEVLTVLERHGVRT